MSKETHEIIISHFFKEFVRARTEEGRRKIIAQAQSLGYYEVVEQLRDQLQLV